MKTADVWSAVVKKLGILVLGFVGEPGNYAGFHHQQREVEAHDPPDQRHAVEAPGGHAREEQAHEDGAAAKGDAEDAGLGDGGGAFFHEDKQGESGGTSADDV